MGIFNKLKNALFEEEEIEVGNTTEKVVIKDEVTEYKDVTEPKKELPLENERELFKAENTFNFPEFDEEEFDINYDSVKEEKPVEIHKTEMEKVKPVSYEPEKKKKVSREVPSRREKKEEVKKEEPKAFRPSPVISPVYGILDKNYKKEDFIQSTKKEEPKKVFDVDMARKKAFGTLEDTMENPLDEDKDMFYNNSKSIDDLLNESIDEEIEIDDANYNDVVEETQELEEFTNGIEEDLSFSDENLEDLDENLKHVKSTPRKKAKVEEKEEEVEEYTESNTLESDLFDLIDSMYDTREEE